LKEERDRHSLLQGVTCFLFDLDGTLIDSSPCHQRSFVQTLETDQPHLVDSFNYELHKGKSTKETFIDLGINDGQILSSMTEKKQSLYRQMVENGEVLAFPFAKELLAALQHRKYRSWVVTGASRRSAEAALSRLQLLDFFEGLITGDESERTKPAPDLYLKCLEDHAIETSSAIAIEDALPGIQSARAAGLSVMAVNNAELSHLPEYVGTLKDLHDIWLLNNV
jgi:HAD superfamily hydrolase (TIGR01509 family)